MDKASESEFEVIHFFGIAVFFLSLMFWRENYLKFVDLNCRLSHLFETNDDFRFKGSFDEYLNSDLVRTHLPPRLDFAAPSDSNDIKTRAFCEFLDDLGSDQVFLLAGECE